MASVSVGDQSAPWKASGFAGSCDLQFSLWGTPHQVAKGGNCKSEMFHYHSVEYSEYFGY